MLIMCNNKGCMKSSNALLDTDTLKVICQECGKEITNITEPMKRTLKSHGQIMRADKKAFMLACNVCKANREIALDQDNNTVCKTCHNPITIHAAFKIAIEEAGNLERINIPKKDKKSTGRTKTKGTKKTNE